MQFKLKQIIFKVLIPTTLVVFLLPTFVLALSKEIQLLWSAWLTPPQTPQQPQPLLPPNNPEVPENERLTDLIEEAVKAEVRESFDLTLNLINSLLAALAVIPIVSGFFLWSLKEQVEKKLTEQSEKIAEQQVQKLIASRTAELKTLKISQIVKLINFSIKQDVHPMIEQEYQALFQQAFVAGFPLPSFIEGVDRETKERLNEYRRIFQSLAESHPEFFRGNDYVWLGDACFILSRYEKASQFYASADQREAHSFRTLHRLGNSKLALKQYEEAIRCYKEALDCTDENSEDFRRERHAWLYHNLGRAHYQQYNYEEAIVAYRQAAQFNPELYHSFYWQGNALSGLGRFVEAIHCFQQAEQILTVLKDKQPTQDRNLKTDQEWILHGMGDAYRKIGDSCHQMSEIGLLQRDGIHQICASEARCENRLNYYKQAIQSYEKALDLNSSNIETLHKRGKAYRELGDYKQAEADYRKAVDLATQGGELEDRCNLLINLADLLRRQATQTKSKAEAEAQRKEAEEKFDLALKICEKRRLKAIKGGSADILEQCYSDFDIARCFALKGEVRRADKFMQDALAHCPPEKRPLVEQWARSDSDFRAWYQEHLKQSKTARSQSQVLLYQ